MHDRSMNHRKKTILSENSDQGIVFKLHRKDKKMTLQELSNQSGIPTKRISNFEKGRTVLTNDTIQLLYSCLGITYCSYENQETQLSNSFYIFYEAVLSYDDNLEVIYHDILLRKEEILTSSAYPLFLLIELIYHIFHDDMFFDFEKTIDAIQAYRYNLDNKQKLIYHDCVALYFMKQKEYDKALEQFEHAAEYGVGGANAIVNYHQGLLFLDINDPCRAMSCVYKAKFFFDNNHYIKRSVLCSFRIACIYRYLHCYDEALPIYENCIRQMRTYHMINKYKTMYIEYLWCLILAERYKNVLVVIDDLDDKLKKSPIFHLYCSLANEKLGQHKLAVKSVVEAKRHLKNYEHISLLKSIVETYYTYLSVNKKQETKLKKLRGTLEEAKKCNNTELQRFIIEMIIDILDSDSQSDMIISYYQSLLQSYKYHQKWMKINY